VISYPEALERLSNHYRPLEREWVGPSDASGRTLSESLLSPGALPAFDNSSMDGFALRVGSEGSPPGTRWAISGTLAAGEPPPVDVVGESQAWEIMTGAPIPPGANAVIPVECVRQVGEVDGRPTWIELLESVSPGQNVRPAGADFPVGGPVLPAGRRLGPIEQMALAALGLREVPVWTRPRVAILSTGPELVGDPSLPLPAGAIRDANGPFLLHALREGGAKIVSREILKDEGEPFQAAVATALSEGVDLVVSTGAVSMGRWDRVPESLRALGAELLFHRVAIRPGRPILVARLPGGALHFGLPGNPISALVGFRFFLLPFLRILRGEGEEKPDFLPLAQPHEKPSALRQFAKARVETDSFGQRTVRILPGQESFRISPLLEADSWAVFPEGRTQWEAGEPVEVRGLLGAGTITG